MNEPFAVRDNDLIELSAKVLTSLVFLFIYGAYRLIRFGITPDDGYLGSIPLGLSVVSFVFLFAYLKSLWNNKRSIANMLKAFSGFVPFLTMLYMLLHLGLYGLYLLFSNFSIWLLVRSLAFVLIAIRGANALHDLSAVGVALTDGRAYLVDKS